jgi:HK97 family phage portal protein
MLGNLFERRGTFQSLWGSGALFDRTSYTGVTVTEDTSLRLSAVYACVRLISDTISTLPVDQFIRRDGQRLPYRPREEWVQNPSMLVDRTTFYQQVIVSLLLDGNAFVHLARDADGSIVEMNVLNPTDVEPYIGTQGKFYRMHSTGTVYQTNEMLHVTEMLLPGDVRGVSRIKKAKDSLGLGLALEEYAARFFGNGAYAGGVIEWPNEISSDQAREIVNSWEANHKGLRRAHRPAVLYGGAKFTPTTVDPQDSQLLDERRFAVEEIARIFRVPMFMLGVTTPGAVSYASVEQQMLFFSQHTIQPYVQKIETAFSNLLQNPQTFLRFNLSSLVRADLDTRTKAYSSALLAGYMSVNDVRALEDMRAVEDGDQYRVPVQNIPLTDASVISVQQKARAAQSLTIAGFTSESIAQLLDLDLESTGLPSVQLQPPPDPAPEE